MARYNAEDSMALVAADTVIGLQASTAVRPKIYEVGVSSSSTPNDYSAHYKLTRFDGTGAGTGTGLTEGKLDTNDGAAQGTAVGSYSAEPTTAQDSPLNFGVNQRSWYRWVASPGGASVLPATANYVVGLSCVAVSTQFTAEAYFHWEE